MISYTLGTKRKVEFAEPRIERGQFLTVTRLLPVVECFVMKTGLAYLRRVFGVLLVLVSVAGAGCSRNDEPVTIILYGFMGRPEQGAPQWITGAYVIKEESNYVKFRVGDQTYTHSGKYTIMRQNQ